ncbi:Outer membrane lipoprotein-sorting protein [Azospirillaceae bacterium]
MRIGVFPWTVAAFRVAGLIVAGFVFDAAAANAMTAHEIMVCSDGASKVGDAKSELTMTLTEAAGGQRVRKMQMMTKLQSDGIDNKRIIRFLSPADIKGTVSLLIEKTGGDDDMWIYLSALKKVRRLVADNKRDSFVGSDMTFGDIIGHKPTDWTHVLLREDVFDGNQVWVIESVPKDNQVKSQTGYAKRLTFVDRRSCIALKSDYWDETGALLKTIRASDIVSVDSVAKKWQFMHIDAVNQQSGHGTVIHFDLYQANQGISDDVFTPRSLEKDR